MDVDVDDMMNGELHRIQANYFTMQLGGSVANTLEILMHIVQSLD